jgi:RNA polymerase sigma factor (TIGR02999 family)
MTQQQDLTEIFVRGPLDPEVLERIVPVVYQELRRVAGARLRSEGSDLSIQATALVHEAYLRLVNVNRMTIENKAHFLALASRVMRQILVDHARRKRSSKRGGDVSIVNVDDVIPAAPQPDVDILALDEALNDMASFDPRQRDLVELKFFAGLTIDEIGAALNISPATVEREWALARAWLHQRLRA